MLEDSDIVIVDDHEFPYLGSLVNSLGRATIDVERRVAEASRFEGFWCSERGVFLDKKKNREKDLRCIMLHCICFVCATLRSGVHGCIRSILGISDRQQ